MTGTGAEAPVGLTSQNALYAQTTAASSRTASAASGITDRSFRNPRAGSAKKRSDHEILETTESLGAQAMSFVTRSGEEFARGGENFAIGRRETRKKPWPGSPQNRASPIDNDTLYLT